jgi:hypothetical protein
MQIGACKTTCGRWTKNNADTESELDWKKKSSRFQRCHEWKLLHMGTSHGKYKFHQPPMFCPKNTLAPLGNYKKRNIKGSTLKKWVTKCMKWKQMDHNARVEWKKGENFLKKPFKSSPGRPEPMSDGHYTCNAGLKPAFFINMTRGDPVIFIPEAKGKSINSSEGFLDPSNFEKETGKYQAQCQVEGDGADSLGYRPLTKLCRYFRGGEGWPTDLGDMDIKFDITTTNTEIGKGSKADPISVQIKFDKTTGMYGMYEKKGWHALRYKILRNTKFTFDNRVDNCLPPNKFAPGKDVNEALGKDVGKALTLLEVDERATESSGPFAGVDGKCNEKDAAHVFQGMDRDVSGENEFDCSTNPNLCDCLVWVGDNKTTVVFTEGKEKLVLKGDGEGVQYEYCPPEGCPASRRRRRLLNVYGKGTS